MSLTECNTVTDLQQRELQSHGNPAFPIACYHDELFKQNVPWHWHPEWEFAIATAGAPRFLLENERIELKPMDGIFINGNALHGVDNPKSLCSQLHSAVFDPNLLGDSPTGFFWQNLVSPLQNSSVRWVVLHQEVPWEAAVLKDFRDAWDAIVYETEDYRNLARYLLSRATSRIVQHLSDPLPAHSHPESERQRIRKMLLFVERYFGSDLTLQSIAEDSAVSESVVLRTFKQVLGISPMQYVKQLRLRKASEQLLHSDESVQSIALSCGFNDISYFNRAFRAQFCMTPGQYRKEYRLK